MIQEEGNIELSLKLQSGEESVSFNNPYPRQGSLFSCRNLREASTTACHNGRDMESTPIGGKVEFETSGVLVAASCELVKGDIDVLGCRDESDEIIQPGTPRKKLRLSIYQSSILEQSFREHSTISPKQKSVLANRLKLQPRQVEVWFQNRKARTKLRRKEVERENLKGCYESLKQENRRLERKVQALRAMEIVEDEDLYTQSPNSMPLVAATLTMCPSCERLAAKTTTATIAL